MIKVICFFVLTSSFAAAQDGRLQLDWDKLASKAVEKVDVNLDGSLLEIAAKFLSATQEDEKVKKLIQGLKGVYVKSFTFDKAGQYTPADLAALRAQIPAPQWTRVVDVQEKNESTGVYVKMNGKQPEGIVVLSAEPKELTLVQIVGPVDLSTLGELGGNLGIPKMEMGHKPKPKK